MADCNLISISQPNKHIDFCSGKRNIELMKKKSLQQIEDFYINLGYRGDKLRKVLTKDKGYQKLLKERKQKLTKQFKINPSEQRKYVLSTNVDFKILAKCKQLEKLKLTKEDKFLVKLIKTQLESDWRKPLLWVLNQLLKKYSLKRKIQN